VTTIDGGPRSSQPMNVNFGLFPPLTEPAPNKGPDGERLRGNAKTQARKKVLSARAIVDIERWLGASGQLAAE